jgi:hypothetical protein
MQNPSNINAELASNGLWTSRTPLWAVLSLLPAIAYMVIIWNITANTPQGDGLIQSIFTVIYYLDADSFAEKLGNTLWTYFQHRAVFSKIVMLSMYFTLGHIDLHTICLLGNFTLCIMVFLIARSSLQHRLPLYSMVIASLMILSFYSWSVANWPECTLFYYGTLLLAFASFYLLDLPRPQVFLAIVCSWLAAFTMANGLLTVVVGSLIVIYNQYSNKRYSSAQLFLWSGSVIGCLAVHFATMNVFSTDLYGAKSVEESFIHLSGRAVDFLESMGAAPFFPNENRAGKIALGCTILLTMAVMATSRKSLKSPAIVGLALFCTGTIFLTSLFRYSAGFNDGYQIFTTTNMAAVLVIGTGHLQKTGYRILPALLLVTALLFNLNPIVFNINKTMALRETLTGDLEKFLATGNPDSASWGDVMVYEGITRNIYRPLQTHQTLKIPADVKTLQDCPAIRTSPTGNITSTTGARALAMKVLVTLPGQAANDNIALLLCGEKNYQLTLGNKNINSNDPSLIEIEALIDKRQFDPAVYHAYLQYGDTVMALTEQLTIPAIETYDRKAFDCKVMTDTFTPKKGFHPIITYYCKKT